MGWTTIINFPPHVCVVPEIPKDYMAGSQWTCEECGSIWRVMGKQGDTSLHKTSLVERNGP